MPRKKKTPVTGSKKPAVDLSKLKIAIVCDWLTGTGGAERVVMEMHKLFPTAPIYTSQYDKNPKIWYGDTWFQDADIRTTAVQRLPAKLKKILPLVRARTFSRLDLSAYDLVIISSSAEAKSVKTGPQTKVIWYCHAPTHYYWSRYNGVYEESGAWVSSTRYFGLGLLTLVRPMRKWDFKVAQQPDYVIANSTHIQSEIKKYYQRDSVVVFPPVDTKRFDKFADKTADTSAAPRRDRYGFVIAGRQIPYKQIDLAVDACSRLNVPLTVIGNGPEHNKLTAAAGQSIRFLNRVSDAEMAHHFQLAQAFIFPGLDDFGIVAVEAQSAGTPVIAYQAGGALDYIKPGKTGEFFESQTVDSLVQTLKTFKAATYKSTTIKTSAERYSIESFRTNLLQAIQNYLAS